MEQPIDQESEPIQEESRLKDYTFDQLLALRQELDQEIQSRQSQELELFREKARQLASNLGLSLQQIVGAEPMRKGKKSSAPSKPYYIDPANPENTCARKGPKSKWLKDYLAQGRQLEEFIAQ